MPDAALVSELSKRKDGLTQILLQREDNHAEVSVRQSVPNEPDGRFTIMDFKGPHTPYAENMINTVFPDRHGFWGGELLLTKSTKKAMIHQGHLSHKEVDHGRRIGSRVGSRACYHLSSRGERGI
jgi:hypothetical protein